MFRGVKDSTKYIFGGCDGSYGKVFSNQREYKLLKNTVFVDCYTEVLFVKAKDII